MNVHVNQIVGGIYGLALMERIKNKSGSLEDYSQNYMAALPVLVMPSALQYYERAEKVFFLYSERIPHRNNYCEYPMIPFGEKKRTPAKDIDFLGKNINIELFQVHNFRHSGYHLLKIHLLVRQELYKYLYSLVAIKKKGDEMSYRVLHDGIILTEEEMEKEISIFEEAVLIYIADTMMRRYKISNLKAVSDFCYGYIKKSVPNLSDASDAWVEEMLKAISIPKCVVECENNVDYSLDRIESKLCFNLENDVARFVSQAYELVYREFGVI